MLQECDCAEHHVARFPSLFLPKPPFLGPRTFFCVFLCVCAPPPSYLLNHRMAAQTRLAHRSRRTAGYSKYAAGRLLWQSQDVLTLLSVKLSTDDGQNTTKMLQQSCLWGCTCCKEGFNESFLCQPAMSEYGRG